MANIYYDGPNDEEENNRQGLEDYCEVAAAVADDEEATAWLEEHSDLYGHQYDD